MEYLIKKSEGPKEIFEFLDFVFEIHEIRQQVGRENGISFHVRTREANHFVPHIHAEYGKYQISIKIETGEVLAGNLPQKQQRFATAWVNAHREKLLTDWRNIAITAISHTTKSALDYN